MSSVVLTHLEAFLGVSRSFSLPGKGFAGLCLGEIVEGQGNAVLYQGLVILHEVLSQGCTWQQGQL